MGRMQDKVVLITAAADGIGLAAAHRLASEGAKMETGNPPRCHLKGHPPSPSGLLSRLRHLVESSQRT